MLKAKLDSVRKNKKGFSLVELIIVIAIMVALIAVMAPAFVKYVQKSRDAAISTASEDFAQAVKTAIIDPEFDYEFKTSYEVSCKDGALVVKAENTELTSSDKLIQFAGCEVGKKMGKSNLVGTIKITTDSAGAKSATLTIA